MNKLIILSFCFIFGLSLKSQIKNSLYTIDRKNVGFIILNQAYSPSGKYLAFGTLDGEVKIYDMRNGQKVQTLKGLKKTAACVAYNYDGTKLATASKDGEIIVWDLTNLTKMLEFKGHKKAIMALAYSPDGETFFTGGRDKIIKV